MNEEEQDTLTRTIEKIEAAYEYMLAYAAQGRVDETGDTSPSIRDSLTDLDDGLETIAYACAEKVEAFESGSPTRQALEDFKHLLSRDAENAQKAVQAVLSVPSLSSQIIDNLNASTHLRCLLTDIFILDETLRLHART